MIITTLLVTTCVRDTFCVTRYSFLKYTKELIIYQWFIARVPLLNSAKANTQLTQSDHSHAYGVSLAQQSTWLARHGSVLLVLQTLRTLQKCQHPNAKPSGIAIDPILIVYQ